MNVKMGMLVSSDLCEVGNVPTYPAHGRVNLHDL